MSIEELSKKLEVCYCKKLCYPKVKGNWNESNKHLGMCAITALIVNDYFGGKIGKIYVKGISHYYNIINDGIIDLTARQFQNEIDYNDYQIIDRMNIMTEDTKRRYTLLKKKLEELK